MMHGVGMRHWAITAEDYIRDTPEVLQKGMATYGEKRTHHVHILAHDSLQWSNKLLFRNYLRTHPDLAKEYAQLKIHLAGEYSYDCEEYTNKKLAFVKRILELAKK